MARSRPILSGAVSAVLVQSSSVTALTAIARASLGTTSVGWIVAVLGFQVNIMMIKLPLIVIGR